MVDQGGLVQHFQDLGQRGLLVGLLHRRQLAGQPTGGQFAPCARTEQVALALGVPGTGGPEPASADFLAGVLTGAIGPEPDLIPVCFDYRDSTARLQSYPGGRMVITNDNNALHPGRFNESLEYWHKRDRDVAFCDQLRRERPIENADVEPYAVMREKIIRSARIMMMMPPATRMPGSEILNSAMIPCPSSKNAVRIENA